MDDILESIRTIKATGLKFISTRKQAMYLLSADVSLNPGCFSSFQGGCCL